MPKVAYEAWQLTSLFEMEPAYPLGEGPWPYTEVEYSLARQDAELTCTLQPAYRDVRIVLKISGRVVYKLEALDVPEIEYVNDEHGEGLRIHLSERDELLLRVKPNIRIAHDFSAQ